ncbi:MAG: hypothetical protein E4H20_01400 [Spirochaetales bacterium]|nr:MAG: hypothetical protein E4H20_01400 [Spirochaetales bacterium]
MIFRNDQGRRSRTFTGFALGLLGAAAILGLGALAVWPLWFMATHHPRTYTAVMLIVVGTLVAGGAIRHRLKGRRLSIRAPGNDTAPGARNESP